MGRAIFLLSNALAYAAYSALKVILTRVLAELVPYRSKASAVLVLCRFSKESGEPVLCRSSKVSAELAPYRWPSTRKNLRGWLLLFLGPSLRLERALPERLPMKYGT
jgi:hypothetical protein